MIGYENRQFMIFSTTELDQIDFNQVCETSADTVRKSVDGTKTFVKWDGEMPQCVANLTTAEGGAVVWQHTFGMTDEEFYKEYMLYSLHGQSKDAFSKM